VRHLGSDGRGLASAYENQLRGLGMFYGFKLADEGREFSVIDTTILKQHG